MKKIASKLFAIGMVAATLTACDDAKNDVIDNMVYISEAATEPMSEIVLGAAGTTSTTKINVRMAQKATTDVKVQLQLDEATLTAYNKRNDTEYILIPTEYLSFPSEVTIPAGASMTEVEIAVTSFEGEAGVDYAAPIKVVSAQGAEVSQGSGSYIITFGKVLTQKTPKFTYDNAMTMDWENPEELTNFTLEWWVRVTNTSNNGGFSVNNQALFSFVSNYELYVRFGDIVYTVNGRNAYNFLQIKTMGIDANYDSGDPNNNPLQWGEWIHFAHTYDAGTGDVILYQNGVEVNRNNGGAGKTFTFSGLNMCASGQTYFRDYVEMCQVRFWRTTRSAAQIAKYMKKEVKYNDPNLVFYLPMNEGSGSILNDVTGNGHNVTIGSASNGSNNEAHAWTEYSFE